MQEKANEYFTPSPLTNKVGCYGCLIYIILFFISGWAVTSAGFHTLWVIPFMAFFVIIWGLLFTWALRKNKKK
jgi:hypothetical protein